MFKLYRKYQVFIGASFVLGLLLAFSLTFFMLHLEKKAIRRLVKQEILEGFDETDLVRLTFTAEEAKLLEWEHSKEFKYQDQFYDVVRTEIANGKVTYVCWLDKQETEVNKKLDHLISDVLDGMPNQHEPTKVMHKLLNLLYSQDYPSFSFVIPVSPAHLIFVGGDEDLMGLSFKPLVPPPNVG